MEQRRTNEYFTEDKFLLINDSFEETRDSLSEILASLQPSNATVSSVDSRPIVTLPSAVHLPNIDIPKFTGDYAKWEIFRDMFESLFASRTDFSNVQKLHCLKENLTDDAGLILSNVHVTEANHTA